MNSGAAQERIALRVIVGGARTTQTSTPAPRKIQTISDFVITVTAALTRKIAHSSLSSPMFFVVS